jgi:hypothetical protein
MGTQGVQQKVAEPEACVGVDGDLFNERIFLRCVLPGLVAGRGIGGHDTYFLLISRPMACLKRIVVDGRAHPVTQRGNWREAVFFEDGDQSVYLDLLAEQCARRDVQIWPYCLMLNHIHLIVVTAQADGLGQAIGGAPSLYEL